MIYYQSDQHWPILLLRLQLELDRAKQSGARLRVLARVRDHAHPIQNSAGRLTEKYGDDLSPDRRCSERCAPQGRQRTLAPNLGRRRKNIRGGEEKCTAVANTLQQKWRALPASIHRSRPSWPAVRRSNASSRTAHPLLATFPVSVSYVRSLTEWADALRSKLTAHRYQQT